MLESKIFNNVKINNLNGIKRKLTFGTYFITTSLLLSLAGTNKVYAENVMVDMPSFNSLKSTSEKARDVLEDVKEEYNSNKKLPCSYGASYSDMAALRALKIAKKIKENNITIFSIGTLNGQKSVDELTAADGNNFSVVDSFLKSENNNIYE